MGNDNDDEIFLWRIIDPKMDGRASWIAPDDKCIYYMDRVHGDWSASEANGKISNLKIGPNPAKRGRAYYRDKAIRQFSGDLSTLIANLNLGEETLLVPIPPSKCESDPAYDDRIVQVCNIVSMVMKVPTAQIIYQTESHEAFHEGNYERDPRTIKSWLQVRTDLMPDSITTVMLVDDVFTSGAHFAACKSAIRDHFSDVEIIGAFWAKQLTDREEMERGIGKYRSAWRLEP